MIQTQAEGAGAQEISRILGQGFEAQGYEVHHVFFFRRTAAFDNEPNAFFCARQRPAGIAGVARMLGALVRHLWDFGRMSCCASSITAISSARWRRDLPAPRRSSPTGLRPRCWSRAGRGSLDLAFGTTGLFNRVVVNSKEIEDEYRRYPRRYRARVARIDHGFESKSSELEPQRRAARRLRCPTASPFWAASRGCIRSRISMPRSGCWRSIRTGIWRWPGRARRSAQLENLAKSLGVLDRLHLMGELSPAQIAVFLRTLDVFVFPSQAESFGLAAVEAAQAGIPVVANDLRVLREVLAIDERALRLVCRCGQPGNLCRRGAKAAR